MKKRCLRLFFHSIVLLTLTSCGQRTELAPVVDLQWQPFDKSATQYRVRPGDTLYAIAFRYDADYQMLARINHLSSPYSLKEGQTISLISSSRITKAAKPTQPLKYSSQAGAKAKPQQSRRSDDHKKPATIHKSVISSWVWPAKGQVIRSFDLSKGRKGLDIKGKPNSEVKAVADGIVAYAGNGLPGYRNLILIKHDHHLLSAYAYNAHLKVKEGQQIKAGQIIADMGMMDRSQWGLHFELRQYGKAINPLKYLKYS